MQSENDYDCYSLNLNNNQWDLSFSQAYIYWCYYNNQLFAMDWKLTMDRQIYKRETIFFYKAQGSSSDRSNLLCLFYKNQIQPLIN